MLPAGRQLRPAKPQTQEAQDQQERQQVLQEKLASQTARQTQLFMIIVPSILPFHLPAIISIMGWSTNEKAQEKRGKEKAQKQEKAQKRQEEAEGKKWRDQQTEKKVESQREKQEKRQREIARKRELKEIAEREEQQLEKIRKKKETFADKKLTHAEIAKRAEQREKDSANGEENGHQKVFYEDNPNREFEGYEVAGTVEEALQILDTGEQKHPEKRFKAAYEAYCAKRDIEIRCQYPKLKRTQRLQMMHKEFEKSPENPFNKNVVAYNDKTRKEARKAKEEEKKEKEKQEEEDKQKIEEKQQAND